MRQGILGQEKVLSIWILKPNANDSLWSDFEIFHAPDSFICGQNWVKVLTYASSLSWVWRWNELACHVYAKKGSFLGRSTQLENSEIILIVLLWSVKCLTQTRSFISIFSKQSISGETSEVKCLYADMWLEYEFEASPGTVLCSRGSMLQRKTNCFTS